MNRCFQCRSISKLKESGTNRIFCNTKCQYEFIQMKRGKSPSSEEEEEEKDYSEFGVFISIIRMSGKCNMIMDAQCIYLSLICLLAFFKRAEYVKYLLTIAHKIDYLIDEKGNKQFRSTFQLILQKYWSDITNDERDQLYERAKATLPYGFDYVKAYKNFHGKPDQRLDELIQYMDDQGFGINDREWAKGIVNKAEELCYEKGIYLRDKVRIDSLRGETDATQLKYAGAQALSW